jgi:hypothetical protein
MDRIFAVAQPTRSEFFISVKQIIALTEAVFGPLIDEA